MQALAAVVQSEKGAPTETLLPRLTRQNRLVAVLQSHRTSPVLTTTEIHGKRRQPRTLTQTDQSPDEAALRKAKRLRWRFG